MKTEDLENDQSTANSGLATETKVDNDSTDGSSGFPTRLLGIVISCAGFFAIKYLHIPNHESNFFHLQQSKFLTTADIFLLYMAISGLYFCVFGDLGTRWLMGRQGPLIAGAIFVLVIVSFLWICPLLWQCSFHLR